MTLTTILAAIAVGMAALWLLSHVRTQIIYSGYVGLLYRDGLFERQLEPGRHRILGSSERVRVHVVPTREVALPQRILSLMPKDQFAFRATLASIVRVTDPRAYREGVGFDEAPTSQMPRMVILPSPGGLQTDRLDAEVLARAHAVASERTLEEFLAAPGNIVEELRAFPGEVSPGLSLERILVTEVTVPPEVRKMFTEVERARREGLAQQERARAEQASLRARANAARSLSDNPQLAELRMLQLMESARGNKTFVLGSAKVDPADTAAA